MSALFDGDYASGFAAGPLMPEAPFTTDRSVYVWRQTWHQLRSEWAPLPRGTQIANGVYLVQETNPRDIGGGIVEWQKVWAKVPERRIERQDIVHTYVSWYNIPGTEVAALARQTKALPAEVWYDYFYAPGDEAGKIPLYSVKSFQMGSEGILEIGGGIYTQSGIAPPASRQKNIPLFNNGRETRIVARDSSLRVWMGDIYERVTQTVVVPPSPIAVPI